jgi:hypothetical protein
MIILLVSVVAIVGLVGIGLLFKFLPQWRWLQGCWTVLAVIVVAALCLALPAPLNWKRVAVPVASDVAAPLSFIRHELNGRMYPGARTYSMKIKAERLTNGYDSPQEEFIVFQSSFITANAMPRTIRLKRNGPPAAIAAYVFANDNTYPLIHKLGIQRSWTEVVKFGFSKPVRELTFEVSKDDSTKETQVVLFVFPLSEQAANSIGDDITNFAEILRSTN